MLTLLVETSGPEGSMALCRWGQGSAVGECPVLGLKKWSHVPHSSFITEAFGELLKEASASVKDIRLVVVGQGPGRFTGVRVAIGFAKTLSFIGGIPVYPVCSLRVLAEAHLSQTGKPVLTLLNAFKNSLYVAAFQKNPEGKTLTLIPPRVVVPRELPPLLSHKEYVCLGDGYQVYEKQFSREVRKKCHVKPEQFPQAPGMVSILKEGTDPGNFLTFRELKPVYLRSPVPPLKEVEGTR